MTEGEDTTLDVEFGEHVSAKLEVTWSKASPKVVVTVKVVAALERIEETPKLVNACFDELITEATKLGLPNIRM